MSMIDDHLEDAMKYLTAAIESELYVDKKKPERGLIQLLCRLGIDSAVHYEESESIAGLASFLSKKIYGRF